MPIYEYKCIECGHKFEDFIQASEKDDIRECPKCGKRSVERLISSFCAGGSPVRGTPSFGGGCGPSGGGFR